MRRRPFWGVLQLRIQLILRRAFPTLKSAYPPDPLWNHKSGLTRRADASIERLRFHCPRTAHLVVWLTGTINDNPYDPRTVRQAHQLSKLLAGSHGVIVKLEYGESQGLHLHLIIDAASPLRRGGRVQLPGGASAKVTHRKDTYDLEGLYRYLRKPSHAGARHFQANRRVLHPGYLRALLALARGHLQRRRMRLHRLAPTVWHLNLPQLPGWLLPAMNDVRGGKLPQLSPKHWRPVNKALEAAHRKSGGRGRPPVADKTVLQAILYKLIKGVGWNKVPNGRTAARRFRAWLAEGVWPMIEKALKIVGRFLS